MPTRSYSSLVSVTALPPGPLHLAIGMFDGVHLGHRAVIESAVQSARRSGGISGVLTFWPHPSRLFNPTHPTRLIAVPEIRHRLLAALGVDLVITEPFTPATASIPAEAFLPLLRKQLPSLRAIYVGENWRFGQGRRGDIAMLIAEGRAQGITIVSAPRINHDGEPISSTRIRACLEEGRIEEANALLGYGYFAEGVVTPGRRLGRTIGFPTLNVPWTPDLCPRLGVYLVRVRGARSAEALPGVANFGIRPTVEAGATAPRLEVHVLGDCSYDVGDEVRVEWLKFLRPEQRFADVNELQAQIARDRDAAIAEFFLR